MRHSFKARRRFDQVPILFNGCLFALVNPGQTRVYWFVAFHGILVSQQFDILAHHVPRLRPFI